MRLGPLLAALPVVLAISLLPAAPAPSAGAAAAAPVLTAAPQYADRDTLVTVSVSPPEAREVTLERWDGAAWEPAGSVTTTAEGAASLAVRVDRQPARNLLRATAEEASSEYRLPLLALATVTTLKGPASVVDEQPATLTIVRRTSEGVPVPGPVRLQQLVDGTWRTVATRSTDAAGTVVVRPRPRTDSRWRAVGVGLAWAAPSASRTLTIDNLPPGRPVVLPGTAPRPRVRLPAQARASGAGANPTIQRIPDGVWRSMVGRSWHRGCPVGRSGLRLVRVNYWDYAGYRRRGELVAAAPVARQVAGALSDLYAARLPIRSMHRVDRFGWSGRLQGANDYRSMAAGNTSAFNCRWVVGRPGVRSPHSYGRALDLNTWENPYHSRQGWEPNSWWPARSHARVAWRSRTHAVVRIMARHGLHWTYGRSDSQHFDAVPRGGRLIVVPGCADVVCH